MNQKDSARSRYIDGEALVRHLKSIQWHDTNHHQYNKRNCGCYQLFGGTWSNRRQSTQAHGRQSF